MFKITINGNHMEFTNAQECAEFVKAMGSSKATKPTGAKAPQPKAEKSKVSKTQPKAESKLFSTDIKDYEPKAQGDNYSWASYKAQRSKYCYSVATDGHCNANPYGSKWASEGGVVDYSPNGKYYTAKAEFEATYKYITVANRG